MGNVKTMQTLRPKSPDGRGIRESSSSCHLFRFGPGRQSASQAEGETLTLQLIVGIRIRTLQLAPAAIYSVKKESEEVSEAGEPRWRKGSEHSPAWNLAWMRAWMLAWNFKLSHLQMKSSHDSTLWRCCNLCIEREREREREIFCSSAVHLGPHREPEETAWPTAADNMVRYREAFPSASSTFKTSLPNPSLWGDSSPSLALPYLTILQNVQYLSPPALHLLTLASAALHMRLTLFQLHVYPLRLQHIDTISSKHILFNVCLHSFPFSTHSSPLDTCSSPRSFQSDKKLARRTSLQRYEYGKGSFNWALTTPSYNRQRRRSYSKKALQQGVFAVVQKKRPIKSWLGNNALRHHTKLALKSSIVIWPSFARLNDEPFYSKEVGRLDKLGEEPPRGTHPERRVISLAPCLSYQHLELLRLHIDPNSALKAANNGKRETPLPSELSSSSHFVFENQVKVSALRRERDHLGFHRVESSTLHPTLHLHWRPGVFVRLHTIQVSPRPPTKGVQSLEGDPTYFDISPPFDTNRLVIPPSIRVDTACHHLAIEPRPRSNLRLELAWKFRRHIDGYYLSDKISTANAAAPEARGDQSVPVTRKDNCTQKRETIARRVGDGCKRLADPVIPRRPAKRAKGMDTDYRTHVPRSLVAGSEAAFKNSPGPGDRVQLHPTTGGGMSPTSSIGAKYAPLSTAYRWYSLPWYWFSDQRNPSQEETKFFLRTGSTRLSFFRPKSAFGIRYWDELELVWIQDGMEGKDYPSKEPYPDHRGFHEGGSLERYSTLAGLCFLHPTTSLWEPVRYPLSSGDMDMSSAVIAGPEPPCTHENSRMEPADNQDGGCGSGSQPILATWTPLLPVAGSMDPPGRRSSF
ncbi:hypothetical protein CCUS01_16290 [Colletotrichum cuscutae]|uniref:Uncharacterized protein n=1 Tax=Colletotrichum cuscutae TaxID=1209917 RepID=A0AAI9Y5R9_9PEZI|nr:hypothetical protein CCUS01_16290 [Colletotrichum cuscutae]